MTTTARKAILFTALVLFSSTSLLAGTPRQRSARVGATAVRALTTATIAADRTAARYGEIIEFTVTVTPSGSGQPTGIVWLYSAGGGGQMVLDGGKAIVKAAASPVGVHSIYAEYLGNANFEPSVTNSIQITGESADQRRSGDQGSVLRRRPIAALRQSEIAGQ